MRNQQRPTWDVHGVFVIFSGPDVGETSVWVRCYPDGHSVIDMGGVTYPIPATMTATAWFNRCLGDMFAEADDAVAGG